MQQLTLIRLRGHLFHLSYLCRIHFIKNYIIQLSRYIHLKLHHFYLFNLDHVVLAPLMANSIVRESSVIYLFDINDCSALRQFATNKRIKLEPRRAR